MDKKKIVVNIFSNWTNFIILIIISFFVSPIVVHRLGDEAYGVWTLIVSLTGYFTVLDFGINTALIRFISMYRAKKDTLGAQKIYSTSFLFFGMVSAAVIICTALFALFFKQIFSIEVYSTSYLYIVFFIVGTDIALCLVFSVFMGSLKALQEFFAVNVISIVTNVLRNIILVIMLLQGFHLMTLAFIQLTTSVIRSLLQYILIRRKYSFLRFRLSLCSKDTLKQIGNYSVYSFIISIVMKVLFYTDSVVIGSLLSIKEIVYYSIPMTLFIYLEQLVYAMTSVLTPLVSTHNATGDDRANKKIYTQGTIYSLIICMPVLFVLFTHGDSFISLWMGEEYGKRSTVVLKILVIGYFFSLSQLIANSILKGVSKHKIFSFILVGEAVLNLAISICLVKPYGIKGVALGTAIPLVFANFFLIPYYTCSVLNIPLSRYLWQSFSKPLLLLLVFWLVYLKYPVEILNYYSLVFYSLIVLFLFGTVSLLFLIEKEHRTVLFEKIVKGLPYR